MPSTRPQRTRKVDESASGPVTSFEEMLRLKGISGYVVGDMVEAKHRVGGWHFCTIVGKMEGTDGPGAAPGLPAHTRPHWSHFSERGW